MTPTVPRAKVGVDRQVAQLVVGLEHVDADHPGVTQADVDAIERPSQQRRDDRRAPPAAPHDHVRLADTCLGQLTCGLPLGDESPTDLDHPTDEHQDARDGERDA